LAIVETSSRQIISNIDQQLVNVRNQQLVNVSNQFAEDDIREVKIRSIDCEIDLLNFQISACSSQIETIHYILDYKDFESCSNKESWESFKFIATRSGISVPNRYQGGSRLELMQKEQFLMQKEKDLDSQKILLMQQKKDLDSQKILLLQKEQFFLQQKKDLDAKEILLMQFYMQQKQNSDTKEILLMQDKSHLIATGFSVEDQGKMVVTDRIESQDGESN